MTDTKSDDNLTLLQQAQRHAAQQALDAVERDKSGEVAVEATGDGLEASISATVTKTPEGLSWLRGGRVTGFLSRTWAGATSWGGRFTKKL